MVTSVFSGIGVGSSAALGKAWWLKEQGFEAAQSTTDSLSEQQKLKSAISEAAAELRAEFSTLDIESQQIMDALLVIFEDPELVSMAQPHLVAGWDSATALKLTVDDYASLFEGDADFETRAGDLRALAGRVIAKLRGSTLTVQFPEGEKLVVIARDLTPLDTARFNNSVVGVVTELGGPTSHAAIICRARGIPAIVACGTLTGIADGASVLVDPEGNRAVLDGTLSDATMAMQFVTIRDKPLIPVRANIGSVADAKLAAQTAAMGVGLLRTEVLYLDARSEPDVAEQTATYREVFEAAPAGEITVRTLDAGSDKPVPFLALSAEENPALGIRGFRLSGHYSQFLKNQLQAISAAAEQSGRQVSVMAPMISTVAEAREFCSLGRAAGLTSIGIMIETPAIAAMVHRLGGVVDFLSIGTNDLSQYLFAADRMHPSLGTLLNPWQPALLSVVNDIISQAEPLNVPVGICGESAANPLLALVFTGMGAASVSVSPAAVGAVDSALRAVTAEAAKDLAAAVLLADSPEAALAAARQLVGV